MISYIHPKILRKSRLTLLIVGILWDFTLDQALHKLDIFLLDIDIILID